MRLVILGAGLAGAVAAGATSSYGPVVFEAREKKDSGLKNHNAVMRIRDPKVALLLGCEATPITAHKMILSDGKLTDQPSISANNEYSLKVSGREVLADRSIGELGRVQRYLIPKEFEVQNVHYGASLLKIENQTLHFKNRKSIEYDYCISTLPMPVMMEYASMESDAEFETRPIHIARVTLPFKSSVHQTVYVPDYLYGNIYRATIENSTLIIESMKEAPAFKNIYRIAECLGLTHISSKAKTEGSLMPQGKMIPIDEETRKQIIFELTVEHSVLSFGRYAIWKPIRADHLVSDIETVKELIKMKKSSYTAMKNRTGGK